MRGFVVWRAGVLALLVAMGGMNKSEGSQQTQLAADMLTAADRGDAPALERLIAGGAPVDPMDDAKRTPLLIAVEGNHGKAAEILINAGANINAQADNLDTPWLQAGALGRTDMLRSMFPRKPDFSIRNRYGGNALIPACERAHVDTVEFLLTTGIDVNHINDLGWTCLLEIVILGDGGPRHIEVAKLVLSNGADPNIADKDGVSPLAYAKKNGQKAVAEIIEAAGGR